MLFSSKYKNTNSLIIIFLIGILFSSFYAIYNINKFDKNENGRHLMIRGDTSLIWREANSFKKDLNKNQNFFGNGMEYTRTFLPSKMIAFYSLLSGHDLFEDSKSTIIKVGGKLPFLLFQIIIYYLSLIFLYKKILFLYDNKNISFCIILYLALDLNIIQWHGTFWTESIFISLQVFLVGMIISKNKTNLFCLSLGLFLGLIFLQKTVGILFILFIIFFIFFSESENKKLKVASIFLGFSLVLCFLGFDNFKKTGIFYIMPTQTKMAHYNVLIVQIYKEKNDLNTFKKIKKSEEEWKIENSYSEDNFKSLYNLRKFQQTKAIEAILNNKIITIKIYLKKIINHSLLNPLQTYYWHKYNQLEYAETEFHQSKESKQYKIFKILYSLIFYIILLIGFVRTIKDKKNYKFHLLLLFLVTYLIFMLGWVGNSRYYIPSIIFLSIFVGHGIDYISKLRYKN